MLTANVNSVNSELSGPNVTTIVHNCREVHSIEPFEIGIAILQSVSEWQHDEVDWSGKTLIFRL